MSYYPTIDEDLARAKQILEKGRDADVPLGTLSAALQAAINKHSGAIYGADIYPAYKLLESFVAEIERLRGIATVPDCDCRTSGCGHKASRHIGDAGACIEPGCPCGPGGWS